MMENIYRAQLIPVNERMEGNLDPLGTGFESRWFSFRTEWVSPYKES
jgi:hypothetical protein